MNFGLQYAKQGIPIGIFCLETDVWDIQKQMVINMHKGVPKVTSKDELVKVLKETLYQQPIKYFSDKELEQGLSKGMLLGMLKELRDRYGIKVFIIDNLEFFVASDGSSKELHEKIYTLVNALKAAAKTLGVMIIGVVAVNNSNSSAFNHTDMSKVPLRVKTRPHNGLLKGSSSWKQYADYIVFVHRDTSPNATQDERKMIEVIVSKNRYGDAGIVCMNYDKSTCTFNEI
jgi:replicative DNA helicase